MSVLLCLVRAVSCVCVFTAQPVSAARSSSSVTETKSFYNNSTPQPSRPPVNNVRVYNGGAPVGFVDTPSNIHPIASLTPYQNRSSTQSLSVC